ncbi:MAG: GNAT family N-acetyltransferase [Burkholderiales bacterium]|nr:GNAT family N-acetyltransferase [Burkholderiales bacterium]
MSVLPVCLFRPGPAHVARYCDALRRGWSADNVRGLAAADEELALLQADPDRYYTLSDDRVGIGMVTLPDGSQAQRLPWMRRWIFAGDEMAGSINLRWQAGTEALPPHVLGHIGYAVVPWLHNRGIASAALAALLPEARALGLRWVELTTDEDNLASQRVMARCGAVMIERFDKPAAYGGKPSQRWRIPL